MNVVIIVRMVSVDVKQHWNINVRAQELCESRHNSPYCLNGRKATSEHSVRAQSCVKVDVAVLGSRSLFYAHSEGPVSDKSVNAACD